MEIIGLMQWDKFFKIVFTAEGIFGLAQTIWPWAAAIVSAAVTFGSGIAGSVPLPYLLASTSVVFAAVPAALLALNEWRFRTSAQGKLAFDGVPFARDYADKDGNRKLTAVQFAIALKNSARFPMHYQIEDIRSDWGGRIATTKGFENRGGTVNPNDVNLYWDATIPVDLPIEQSKKTGSLTATVTYWKSPFRKHRLDVNVKLTTVYNPERNDIVFNRWYSKLPSGNQVVTNAG